MLRCLVVQAAVEDQIPAHLRLHQRGAELAVKEQWVEALAAWTKVADQVAELKRIQNHAITVISTQTGTTVHSKAKYFACL